MVDPEIEAYIKTSITMFDRIPDARKARLKELTRYVEGHIESGQEARLVFICTHNSRRSHIAQIWAQAAAAYYSVPRVLAFSGGTEATAFSPRAVAALKRAGFTISKSTEDTNPHYQVAFSNEAKPIEAFSKVYSQSPNPNKDFCAVMTCSAADAGCPVVFGSDKRVSIPYIDPKEHDNTDRETQAYDERCRQISTEMLYLFSRVKASE